MRERKNVAIFCAVSFVAILALTCQTGMAAEKSKWPKGVAIGTSSIGGTYYLWAGGWARLLKDKMKMEAAVEAGGGPSANVQKIDSKQTEFGMVTMGIAFEGFNGTGWAKKKYNTIRAMFPMYVSYLHAWAIPQCNIKTVRDFEGKTVNFAMPGATPYLYYHRLMEFAKIKPGKIISGQYPDITEQMKDNLVCNSVTASSFPHPTCLEMVTTQKANVFGVPKEIAVPFAKANGISTGIIPKGVYAGVQPKEAEFTVTIWNAMIAHKDQPADFIYEVVKTTMENREILEKTHPSAKETLIENASLIASIPLHPGAIKYYTEKGVKLPPEAYPPGYKR
jgi:TRAP transporter TAXI family solute receptor